MRPSVFDPELEYITVAETRLSDVDGENGTLRIGGYSVEDLAANATYEESVFLLFNDRLPTAEELEAFKSDLTDRRQICEAVREVLRRAAANERPAMDALRMGMAAATLETSETEPRAVAKRVVAVLPTIAATYWRYRQGTKPVSPTDKLGHAANYLTMITGEEPTATEVRGLETFLTTCLDHGLNPSTFTARIVVSTESDIVSATTAAIGTLKGPRHGGGLGPVFEMLQAVHESGDPEGYVHETLDAGERLRGFGHRIYHVRDPRAAVLSTAAEPFYEGPYDDFLESVREFETVATSILADRWPHRRIQATLEFYAAAHLHGLGVPPELFTATFAISRVGGWAAHCLEQLGDNGLVRPTARYVGPTDETWTPLENRRVGGDSLVEEPIESSRLESVSETLGVLSEPSRLEILLVLSECDEPIDYSTLRELVSIEDKGRFNYHLRQLRKRFVATHDGEYELLDPGRAFVRTVLTEDDLLEELLE